MTSSRGFLAGALLAPVALISAFWAGLVMAEAQKPAEASLSAARELIVATGASKQFEAVVPMMVKVLPDSVIGTIAAAMELNGLSQELDRVLLSRLSRLSRLNS